MQYYNYIEFSDGKEEKTEQDEDNADYKLNLLSKMKQYNAKTTIFELNPKPDSAESIMMAQKRRVHADKIARQYLEQEELQNDGSTPVNMLTSTFFNRIFQKRMYIVTLFHLNFWFSQEFPLCTKISRYFPPTRLAYSKIATHKAANGP